MGEILLKIYFLFQASKEEEYKIDMLHKNKNCAAVLNKINEIGKEHLHRTTNASLARFLLLPTEAVSNICVA